MCVARFVVLRRSGRHWYYYVQSLDYKDLLAELNIPTTRQLEDLIIDSIYSVQRKSLLQLLSFLEYLI
jgi:hypothetical protein